MTYIPESTISIRRVLATVIEYDVTTHDPIGGDQTRTLHANREATFHGPHTGNPARQVTGGASTLWRADDQAMLFAFAQRFGRRIRSISVI
jgi:hypothetical protein